MRPRSAPTQLSATVLLLSLGAHHCRAHQLCRDGTIPLNIATPAFCNYPTDDGYCCTPQADAAIQKAFLASPAAKASAACQQFAKQLACATCSAYSAHMFETRTTDVVQCGTFCQQYYAACSAALGLGASASAYCKAPTVTTPDPTYCFPYVPKPAFPIQDNSVLRPLWTTATASIPGPLVDMKRHPDTTRQVYWLADQAGRIWEADAGGGEAEFRVLLDMTSLVNGSWAGWGSELGLLSMAFSPAFMTTRHIFFSLIMGDGSKYGALAVLRLTMKPGTNNAAVLASRRVLFSIPQITGMHKGGWLGFPPTSSAAAATHLLYISTGDGGPPNDPMGGVPGATTNAGDAQVLTSLHGKLLRVLVSNDESRPAYDIPKDNPFAVAATASKRAEIYAYGFRNPWRCAFDRSDLSGKVWCGDVGQEAIEEVILVSPGVNYGWRGWEGSRCNLQTADPTECKRTPNTVGVWEICHENLIFSAAEKDVATRICKGKKLIGGSLTGGFIYRGKKYANIFNGDYIFADYQNRYLAGLKKLANGQWQEYVILDSSDFPQGQNFPQIASFAEDRDGELYMIAWEQNTHQNRVYKLPCGRMCNTGYVVPALSVPGKIEAEAFIAGDEGVAYHNVPKGEPPTTSNKLRTSAITVQDLDNKAPDGRYIVGWTGPGEWMRYQVTVATAGRYVPKYRVARGQTPALPCGFSLLVDASRTARADTLCPSATAKMGAWSAPLSTTGPNGAVSWTTYIDVAGAPFTLAAGAHTLTLCIDSGDANIDYFTLAAAPAVRGAKKQVKKTRELDVAPDGWVSEAFEAFEEELEEYGEVEVVFEDGQVEEAVFEDVSAEDTDPDIGH